MEHNGRNNLELRPKNEFEDYSDIDLEQVEEFQEEIFRSWFENQDQPVLEAVESVKVDNPSTTAEKIKNLFADSYMYTKRAEIRVDRQTKGFLDEKYPQERRDQFAFEDVSFQQDAVHFLRECDNNELIEEFWSYFEENYDIMVGSDREKRGAKQGILAVNTVIDLLKKEGYEVEFPTSKQDAVKKIDLIAEKDGSTLFLQIKSTHNSKIDILQENDIKNKIESEKQREELNRFFKVVSHNDSEGAVIRVPNVSKSEYLESNTGKIGDEGIISNTELKNLHSQLPLDN
ncbi:MAG: hypothetical protein ABEI74_01600 [Candidatus Pacearchaeota archaeon]